MREEAAMIEAPFVSGPPDPAPQCCGRDRAEQVADHAEACVAVDHDDCTFAFCTLDDDCTCACRACARVRVARARWEDIDE